MWFIFDGIQTLTFAAFLEKNMTWHYHDAGDTFDKIDKKMLSDAAVMNPAVFEHLQSLRKNVYMGSDYREGITAFLERREPVFGQAVK